MPFPNNGEKIRRLIKAKGFTQARFARLLCVEERTLRKMLHDGVYDIRSLLRMADLLSCRVDDLFP